LGNGKSLAGETSWLLGSYRTTETREWRMPCVIGNFLVVKKPPVVLAKVSVVFFTLLLLDAINRILDSLFDL
jgi:hypothetical protein